MLRKLAFFVLAMMPMHFAQAQATRQAAPTPVATRDAGAATSPAGSWALQVEGTTIFRFDILAEGSGWRGTWSKPRSFASDGNSFGRLSGPVVTVPSDPGRVQGDWAELTFPDPGPNAVDDVFRFRRSGPDRLEMLYVDTGLAPFELVRVSPGAAIGPWVADKVYRRGGAASTGAMVTSGAALPASSSLPASAPPPPLSGRDATSRIWSLPAGSGAGSELPRPAAPAKGGGPRTPAPAAAPTPRPAMPSGR